ncbi:hypothetical protein LDFHOB_11870 [Candidatus Electronema aureum]
MTTVKFCLKTLHSFFAAKIPFFDALEPLDERANQLPCFCIKNLSKPWQITDFRVAFNSCC